MFLEKRRRRPSASVWVHSFLKHTDIIILSGDNSPRQGSPKATPAVEYLYIKNFVLERFYLYKNVSRIQIYLVLKFQIDRAKGKLNIFGHILTTFDKFSTKNSLKRAHLTDFEAKNVT